MKGRGLSASTPDAVSTVNPERSAWRAARARSADLSDARSTADHERPAGLRQSVDEGVESGALLGSADLLTVLADEHSAGFPRGHRAVMRRCCCRSGRSSADTWPIPT